MAWTTPRTWVTGETPTAAQFNAHVRDNLNFLYGSPSCRVYNSAAITIANVTGTSLTFDSERWDNDTMHSTSANTERITTITAGRYVFVACDEFVANATGIRWATINNSVVDIAAELLPVVSAAAVTILNVCGEYTAAANDIFVSRVYQSSGGNLNVNSTANYSPEFMAHWMGN